MCDTSPISESDNWSFSPKVFGRVMTKCAGEISPAGTALFRRERSMMTGETKRRNRKKTDAKQRKIRAIVRREIESDRTWPMAVSNFTTQCENWLGCSCATNLPPAIYHCRFVALLTWMSSWRGPKERFLRFAKTKSNRPSCHLGVHQKRFFLGDIKSLQLLQDSS